MIVGTSLTASSYYIQGKVTKDAILQQLYGILLSSDSFQPADVKEAMKNPSQDSVAQKKLIAIFDRIKKNPNVAQAYVLGTEIKNQNQVQFISLPTNILDTGTAAGKWYDQPTEVLDAIGNIKATKKITYTNIYKDQFGTWATIMKPIMDGDGNVFAYYAIDIDASIIHKGQSTQLIWSILFLIVLLFLMIFFQFRGLRRLLLPIQDLYSAMEEISTGNLDIQVKVHLSNDIGRLIENFNLMVRSLKEIVIEIESKALYKYQTSVNSDPSLFNIKELAENAKHILERNEQQYVNIEQENKALVQYAEQVEKVTLLEERNRMAQGLHDTLGHIFTSLIMGLEILHQSNPITDENLEEKINSLLNLARNGFVEIRNNVHNIAFSQSNTTLSEDMEQIVNQFKQQTEITTHFHVSGSEYPVLDEIRLATIRCLQESLTNAVRHGKATNIMIDALFAQRYIYLKIHDNGVGTDEIIAGFGLQTMKNRVENLQGTLTFTSTHGGGMIVECRIPTSYNTDKKIKVLLVDDQELILESLQFLLQMQKDMEVVSKTKSSKAAIDLCEILQPDICIIDINMPEMDGVQCTRIIKERWPHIKIIILTTFHDTKFALEGLDAGADGYILKSIHPKQLINGIRLVYNGGALISEYTAKSFVNQIKGLEIKKTSELEQFVAFDLTKKEYEILNLLSEGLTYQEIAEQFYLSKGTVKNYISTIYSKMNVSNRTQAIKKYKENNRA